MGRHSFAATLLLALTQSATGQSLPPDEAVKRMRLPDDFSVRCVASEPMVRQPVSISFDTRGRMWVLQYLQYPSYAGLKPVKQDQYLRTIWDRIPEPPPRGPKGADRLTILFDPDEHGVFRKSRDFVAGLNIASGFCLGHGGVYVVQPPYLLFYPDKDEDDMPDGDPEVLLSGFGMDDTHSLANSLQWGPDGWLYGASGSTSTCKIKNLAHPADEVIEFQQGLWRFHPRTKKFELFSEGGGNTYGLDFDQHGQAIAGTNWGGFAMLHQMQGAYYVKGFAKHGPLHNPHTYGYFDHVPYKGFKGGHVTCGGILYQADTYPEKYRNQYIAANLLSNDVYWHRLERDRSSFTATHGGELIQGNDPWFRPIDLLQGPDGCVYVVDFYDRRAAHLDPIDNWDKTNGRIYRIEYRGGPKYEDIDLRKKTSAELAELLKHKNKWWRNAARQLIIERGDRSVNPSLLKLMRDEKGTLALEALWAMYGNGGCSKEVLGSALKHSNEYVRAWAVRLATEVPYSNPPQYFIGVGRDSSPAVLAQLACSARRMHFIDARIAVQELLRNPVAIDDPRMSLLIWWAVESHLTRSKGAELNWLSSTTGQSNPLVLDLAQRYARRMMAGDFENGPQVTGQILTYLQDRDRPHALRGIAQALEGRVLMSVPEELRPALETYWQDHAGDRLALEIMARMNVPAARIEFRRLAVDPAARESDRLQAISIVMRLRDPKSKDIFLQQLSKERSDAIRIGLLGALEVFEDPRIGETILAAYPGYSPVAKRRALQLLLLRPMWAIPLFQAIDMGKFPKTDIAVEQARAAVSLDDKALTTLVEKHFGKLAPATAGEKQARIAWLNAQIPREKADTTRGQALYAKHCAACHKLHGEGGAVGPDLTTSDRKNRGYLLAQIVDPSGYIRPEFVVQNILTTDERKVSGIATETGESISIVTVVNDKPVTTVIAKKDIADVRPSAVSLMPEKLLDTLTDSEVADLVAFLTSDGPRKTESGAVPFRTLKVCLVSGSFEYQSDASLIAFQKYLEANFPVQCSRAFAKSDKDRSLAGIENLATCDVAVFFTRRLQIEGEALDSVKKYVKSGKPIIGIRTASHGFQNWLEMDREVLGGDYKGHFGANVTCEVMIAEKGKNHPILKGVSEFQSNGSLYKNPGVAADVVVLLTGRIPKESEPIAWVREKDGRRVFYTSLGHPDDFKDANFTRMLVNALAWATKTELKSGK